MRHHSAGGLGWHVEVVWSADQVTPLFLLSRRWNTDARWLLVGCSFDGAGGWAAMVATTYNIPVAANENSRNKEDKD